MHNETLARWLSNGSSHVRHYGTTAVEWLSDKLYWYSFRLRKPRQLGEPSLTAKIVSEMLSEVINKTPMFADVKYEKDWVASAPKDGDTIQIRKPVRYQAKP